MRTQNIPSREGKDAVLFHIKGCVRDILSQKESSLRLGESASEQKDSASRLGGSNARQKGSASRLGGPSARQKESASRLGGSNARQKDSASRFRGSSPRQKESKRTLLESFEMFLKTKLAISKIFLDTNNSYPYFAIHKKKRQLKFIEGNLKIGSSNINNLQTQKFHLTRTTKGVFFDYRLSTIDYRLSTIDYRLSTID